MTNRRAFLKFSGALALGSMLNPLSLLAQPKRAEKPIGLQLYSLRDDFKSDPKGTLKNVADIGYKHLESASYTDGQIYGMAPTEFKMYIEDIGLKLRSAHLGGPRYVPEKKEESIDWWKTAVADHHHMGASYIIKPSMPIPATLKELDIWNDYYNAIGDIAQDAGLQFGFHNHAREFEKIEGEVMLEHMIKNTNPATVCFELDVYWCKKGGQDPATFINKHAGRFPLLHIKDEKELGESGDMDYQPIFEAAYKQGLDYYFVEVEQYNFEPLESVRQSFNYLNEAPYVL
ncbi:sugar phosphate isomerase/epimerase family protein [Anditalea andensis]|uniref:Sugar phosphate isomerase n=1 Tax=Anditalea andensis TaxID=1048983 RepID=A0A074L0Z4_9BACT|nr:sugar phosphate isomerase/epimerase [Anditalea andensis]KEO74115.1 sugar phosphate isomerase [Anditalea andensis]